MIIDMIEFIQEILTIKPESYIWKFVCNFKHLKMEPHMVRLVSEGNKLNFEQDTVVPVASLLETKLIINSSIS